jgi:hypothetical protein
VLPHQGTLWKALHPVGAGVGTFPHRVGQVLGRGEHDEATAGRSSDELTRSELEPALDS